MTFFVYSKSWESIISWGSSKKHREHWLKKKLHRSVFIKGAWSCRGWTCRVEIDWWSGANDTIFKRIVSFSLRLLLWDNPYVCCKYVLLLLVNKEAITRQNKVRPESQTENTVWKYKKEEDEVRGRWELAARRTKCIKEWVKPQSHVTKCRWTEMG